MSEETTDWVLSEAHRHVLEILLDEIIPPSGPPGSEQRFPGANELGLVAHVEQSLRRMQTLRPIICAGLAALDELAGPRNAKGFAALPAADRFDVLGQASMQVQEFLPALTMLTYAGYYKDPRVLKLLGREARPPHPKGYEMEPNDLTLLDPVRRRGKLYREC